MLAMIVALQATASSAPLPAEVPEPFRLVVESEQPGLAAARGPAAGGIRYRLGATPLAIRDAKATRLRGVWTPCGGQTPH